jgi:hypothetical protein
MQCFHPFLRPTSFNCIIQGLNTQKPKLHIEHMPQKVRNLKTSKSTACPTLGIILSDCDKIKYEQS